MLDVCEVHGEGKREVIGQKRGNRTKASVCFPLPNGPNKINSSWSYCALAMRIGIGARCFLLS